MLGCSSEEQQQRHIDKRLEINVLLESEDASDFKGGDDTRPQDAAAANGCACIGQPKHKFRCSDLTMPGILPLSPPQRRVFKPNADCLCPCSLVSVVFFVSQLSAFFCGLSRLVLDGFLLGGPRGVLCSVYGTSYLLCIICKNFSPEKAFAEAHLKFIINRLKFCHIEFHHPLYGYAFAASPSCPAGRTAMPLRWCEAEYV